MRLKDSYKETGSLLIWPQGYSLSLENGFVWIKDAAGQRVVYIHGGIRIGGFEVDAQRFAEYTGEPVPEGCPGPYFVITEVLETVPGQVHRPLLVGLGGNSLWYN